MEDMEIEEPNEVPARLLFRRIYQYKYKLILCVLGFSLCVYGIVMGFIKMKEYYSFCDTLECKNAVRHINEFVDSSVDPCDDFYKFACGNFHKNYARIGEMHSTLTRKQIDFDRALMNLLVDEKLDENLWIVKKNIKLARKFYKTCFNVTAYKNNTDLAFLEAVDYITGGWPTNQTEYKFESWQNVMLKSRKIGLHFDFFLDVNITEFPYTYLQISPPNLKEFVSIKEVWWPENKKYIQEIANYWGYNESSLYWEFDATMDFANKLHDVILSGNLDIKNQVYRKILKRISSLTKSRQYEPDWLPFIQNLTGLTNLSGTDWVYLRMKPDPPNYLSNLNKLIENTPIRHWVNYIIVYNIIREYEYLSENIQSVVNRMLGLGNSSRLVFCLLEAGTYFRKDAERFMVNHILLPDEKEHIETIYNDIFKSLEWHVKQEFASNATLRDGCLARMKNITLHIGATEHFFDDMKFEEAFGTRPDHVSDNMVEMLHELEKSRIDNLYSMTQKPSGFHNRVLEIVASSYFFTTDKSLYLLAPLLLEPIYSMNRPEYLNYGALGSILAHELMHMFDYRLWGKYYKMTDWESAIKEYRVNSTACATEAYKNYYKKLFNSSNVLVDDMEEILADYGAANIAYLAYSKYRTGSDKILKGISYDPDQIFWIMTSTYFCDDLKLEQSEAKWSAPDQPISRRYPLFSYRVNGPKMNSPHFAKSFGCKLGSNMNPIKKCTYFP